MAVALSGCVITEEKGKLIKYVRKCEKCGHLLPGQTSTSISIKGSKKTASFTCPKCKTKNKIIIQC